MALEEEQTFLCPYCTQSNSLLIDLTGGTRQEFVTDCEVCCAPITVRVHLSPDEILSIDLEKE